MPTSRISVLFVGGAGDDLMFNAVGSADIFVAGDERSEGLDRIYGFVVGDVTLDIGGAMITELSETAT